MQLILKRIFDILFSLIIILILSPVLLTITILIKITSKGPILFKQERVGQYNELFKIYKFRSMIQNAEKLGSGYYMDGEDDPRITRVGKILRKTSLDELPELFNVLKGEMSLAGPRPTLKYQVDKYSEFQKKRLEYPPGITGWAQINGRNEIPWSKRIELDIWYIDNYSFLLDIKILLLTLPRVLSSRGISHNQSEKDVDDL
ncbi:MAG TPA: sugar transferase [Sporosarcina psychrophila]|uniref:Sugar transferase n=1 Tax=Sporosarcina psychrophila TaxID=1476 RepID=A0A921G366_SPOPS|nr:sugar transferase [Sporosarcina psychrophila]